MTIKNYVQKGFTLIEVIMVVALISVLSGTIIIITNPPEKIREAREAQTKKEMRVIAEVSQAYLARNGVYPSESTNAIPADLIDTLPNGRDWINGPFPGSTWDWENWVGTACWNGATDVLQISLRGVDNYAANDDHILYYVIQGSGIPDCNDSNAEGTCLNCP